MNDEELESIPWSTLLSDGSRDRSRLIYVAAGALIVFAVAALVARSLWRPSVAEPVAVPSTVTTTTTTTAASILPVITEADLMAIVDDESFRASAAFAEWFVFDYFTVDGDAATLDSLLEALPPGVPVELLPHGSSDVVTYVEWARAARVTEAGAGLFEVLVLFRMVSAEPGQPFVRDETRAVTVNLALGDGGGWRLTELPAPAPVPERPDVPEWVAPVGSGAAGPNTAAQVLSWQDAEFAGLSAEKVDGSWRLLFTSTVAGTTWPLLIDLPEDFAGWS